jgi:hypothetical protein
MIRLRVFNLKRFVNNHMATNEEELQREWRGIVISKLDKLDTELKDMRAELETATATARDVADIRTRLHTLEIRTSSFRTADEVHDKYVSKEDFAPIKNLVYGAITLGLVTLATAVLSLVVAH